MDLGVCGTYDVLLQIPEQRPFSPKNALHSFNYAPYFLGDNDSLSDIFA
jgi:hypothetical protein